MGKIVPIAHINSRPLSEFRSDPRVRAWNALDDHFGTLSEEIEVETYADVLDACQRIDASPTTVWRFVPGYDREVNIQEGVRRTTKGWAKIEQMQKRRN